MKKNLLHLIIMVSLNYSFNNLMAQFSEQTGIYLSGGSIFEWGDYDNDGDLDVLIAGDSTIAKWTPVYYCKIFRNDGSNIYTEQTSITLPGFRFGDAKWVDLNNDNYLDLIISGQGDTYLSKIFINNTSNNFYEVGSFPVLNGSTIECGDINNDGFIDFILCGLNPNVISTVTKVFKNNGNLTFTEQVSIGLSSVCNGVVSLGDYNNDGEIDILIVGDTDPWDMQYAQISKIYKNNGNFNFTEVPNTNFTGISSQASKWIDFDSDGKLDVFLAGWSSDYGYIFKLYKNNGNDNFTEIIINSIYSIGSATWGDYNNDGLLDIAITGYNGATAISKIYKNNGNNTFTEQPSIILPTTDYEIGFVDYDNDRSLDIIFSGNGCRILKNNNSVTNNKPNPPTNLITYVNGTDVIFNWSLASDDHTLPTGLTYNSYISSTSHGFDIATPNANTITGFRKIVNRGYINSNNGYTIKGLIPGIYYWGIQAIDNSYIGSLFSNESTFTIPYIFNGETDKTIICGESVQLMDTVINKLPATQLTYSWSPSSGLSSSTIPNPVASPNQTTTYIVTASDGTFYGSDTIVVTVAPLIANVNGGSIPCGGQIALQSSTNCSGCSISSYSWSPTTGLSSTIAQQPYASPSHNTTYTVTIMTNNGCTASATASVTVNSLLPIELCLVSVDTSTWKNKIMWINPPQQGSISSFYIYKEVSVNIYNWLGAIPFNQPSFFIDYTSQPEVHGDKYKIAILDTCGNESTKSYYHKTINLTIASFGSTMGLTWDYYVDESGVFVPAKYYIYRGTAPSQMQLYDSISGSFNSYNDPNIFSVYYYMIGVKKDPPCDIFGNIMSFSNKKDNSTLLDISSLNFDNNNVSIFPNPFSEKTTISLRNKNAIISKITITDNTGKVVLHYQPNGVNIFELNRYSLEDGFYFVEVYSENMKIIKPLVVLKNK